MKIVIFGRRVPLLLGQTALAALVQALIKKFSDEYEEGVLFKRPHSAVIRENKWRACRYGLEGEFVTDSVCGSVRRHAEILDALFAGHGRFVRRFLSNYDTEE